MIFNSNLAQSLIQKDLLYESHKAAWKEVWDHGRIEIGGNEKINKAVIGSQYYLFSSIPNKLNPKNEYIGLSPSGLPFGDLDSVRNNNMK